MKLRLHEIELGSADPVQSRGFYSGLLGLEPTHETSGLQVFDAGVAGLDLNVSKHHPAHNAVLSFLTDDLDVITARLEKAGIAYDGPFDSHLGMRGIAFRDPDGFLVKVNQPTSGSPDWLVP